MNRSLMNMFIKNGSLMNMFIKNGSLMNMFIENGSLMNMFIERVHCVLLLQNGILEVLCNLDTLYQVLVHSTELVCILRDEELSIMS